MKFLEPDARAPVILDDVIGADIQNIWKGQEKLGKKEILLR